MTIKDEIIKTIDIMVKSAIKKIKMDKTYPSVITSVEKGKYVVTLNGRNYTVKCSLPNADLRVGQGVWIKIPNGDFNSKHICGIK